MCYCLLLFTLVVQAIFPLSIWLHLFRGAGHEKEKKKNLFSKLAYKIKTNKKVT